MGNYASDVGVFESLSARDLLAYSCWWLPEKGRLKSSAACTRQTAALAEFCRWAERQHQVNLFTDFGETLASIERDLPRVMESNLKIDTKEKQDGGSYFEVTRLEAEGKLTLCGLTGEDLLLKSPHLAESVVPGDWLRCSQDEDSTWRVLRCYPPQAGELLKELAAGLDG